MDNTINPNMSLQMTPTTSQGKSQVVEVTNLPSNLKVGESILLEVLMTEGTGIKLGKGEGQVTLNLLSDNQKIPLQIKTDIPLQTQGATKLSAKVVSQNSLQLIVPDKKIPSTEMQKAPTPETVIVKEINTSLPQAKLFPLSGQQLTAQVMNELKLPLPLQKSINKVLPQTVLSLRIEAPVSASQPQNANILLPLKTAVENLSQAITQGTQPQIELSREQVTTVLQNLESQKFIATPQVTPTSAPSLQQLQSPLGKITLETPLKLPTETRLELSILEIKTEPQQPLEALQKIMARPEFAKLFPEANSTRLLGLLQNRHEAVTTLFKIFEPLVNVPEQALPVLQKLPNFSAPMLSNMVSFYKGAVEQDATLWLGQEVTMQLRSSGAEGQATLQNLQDFVSTSLRETPTWRIVEMPFFDGSQIAPLKIALKKDPEEEQEDTKKRSHKGVRFLIETEFSKLGAFQLDGFSVAKERRLDLVIRTSKRQSEDFCSHIINLFKTSLYNVDYIGTISLNQRQAFIKPEAESASNLTEGVFI